MSHKRKYPTKEEVDAAVKEMEVFRLKREQENVVKVRAIWQCELCEDVVVSYSHIRHSMDSCDCGKSAMDLEQWYSRHMGKIKEISRKKYIDGEWQNYEED